MSTTALHMEGVFSETRASGAGGVRLEFPGKFGGANSTVLRGCFSDISATWQGEAGHKGFCGAPVSQLMSCIGGMSMTHPPHL